MGIFNKRKDTLYNLDLTKDELELIQKYRQQNQTLEFSKVDLKNKSQKYVKFKRRDSNFTIHLDSESVVCNKKEKVSAEFEIDLRELKSLREFVDTAITEIEKYDE